MKSYLLLSILLIFLFFQVSLQSRVGVHFTHEFISMATIKNDMFLTIPYGKGQTRTPTSIAILENGQVVFGEEAKHEKNRVDQIRYLLEHKFDELPIDFRTSYPTKLVQDHFGNPIVELQFINGSTSLIDPIEAFSILVFEKLKETCEDFLREFVDRMIISIPTKFSKQQRRKILDLAPKDLKVDLMEEELLAVKGYDLIPEDDSKILVMDWDDFELKYGVWRYYHGKLDNLFERSDSRIGWHAFDSLFESYWPMGNEIKIDSKQLRCKLTKKHPVQILDNEDSHSNRKLIKEITLEEYVEVSSSLLDIFKENLNKIMELYPPSQIDHIILLNSTCSFPTVSSIIEHQFGKKPLHSIEDPILFGATKLAQFNNHIHSQGNEGDSKHYASHDEL